MSLRLPPAILPFLDMDALATMAAVDGYHREVILSHLGPGVGIYRVSLAPRGLTFGIIVPSGQAFSILHPLPSPSPPVGVIIHPFPQPSTNRYQQTVMYITAHTTGSVLGNFSGNYVTFRKLGFRYRIKKIHSLLQDEVLKVANNHQGDSHEAVVVVSSKNNDRVCHENAVHSHYGNRDETLIFFECVDRGEGSKHIQYL